MANRRDLKKEINLLHSELIMDCITYAEINNKQDASSVVDIINRLIENRKNVYIEINKSTANMTRKEVKERYDRICGNVLSSTDNAYSELSKLPRN